MSSAQNQKKFLKNSREVRLLKVFKCWETISGLVLIGYKCWQTFFTYRLQVLENIFYL